jgi:catechol-2,3-dioxygenase
MKVDLETAKADSGHSDLTQHGTHLLFATQFMLCIGHIALQLRAAFAATVFTNDVLDMCVVSRRCYRP